MSYGFCGISLRLYHIACSSNKNWFHLDDREIKGDFFWGVWGMFFLGVVGHRGYRRLVTAFGGGGVSPALFDSGNGGITGLGMLVSG